MQYWNIKTHEKEFLQVTRDSTAGSKIFRMSVSNWCSEKEFNENFVEIPTDIKAFCEFTINKIPLEPITEQTLLELKVIKECMNLIQL